MIIIAIDKCLCATLVALDWLVREHRRDQHTRSQKLVGIKLKYSFAIMVVIARALPVQRDVHRNRTEQQLVMLCCDRLTDRSSTIKDMGQLEHSRAASFPRHHECNSASRGEFFFLNELEERMWLEFTYLIYRLEEW